MATAALGTDVPHGRSDSTAGRPAGRSVGRRASASRSGDTWRSDGELQRSRAVSRQIVEVERTRECSGGPMIAAAGEGCRYGGGEPVEGPAPHSHRQRGCRAEQGTKNAWANYTSKVFFTHWQRELKRSKCYNFVRNFRHNTFTVCTNIKRLGPPLSSKVLP